MKLPLFIPVATLTAAAFLGGCARQNPDPSAMQQNFTPPATATTAPSDSAPSTAPGTYRADQLPVRAEPGQLEPARASDVALRQRPASSVTHTTSSSAPRYVVHKRSKKKSAAIIGGSAGAGAAIGALAGGGKGAGIGAIVGGVGGLIYDRKTAKKTTRVE